MVKNLNVWYIACSTIARNEILTATPNIHVQTLHWCYSNDSKLQVSKRKSEIQDGGFKNSVAQISVYTHDSNNISTATPMFPGSDNMERLLEIQSYVWACCKLKMAAINRKYMVNYS